MKETTQEDIAEYLENLKEIREEELKNQHEKLRWKPPTLKKELLEKMKGLNTKKSFPLIPYEQLKKALREVPPDSNPFGR